MQSKRKRQTHREKKTGWERCGEGLISGLGLEKLTDLV